MVKIGNSRPAGPAEKLARFQRIQDGAGDRVAASSSGSSQHPAGSSQRPATAPASSQDASPPPSSVPAPRTGKLPGGHSCSSSGPEGRLGPAQGRAALTAGSSQRPATAQASSQDASPPPSSVPTPRMGKLPGGHRCSSAGPEGRQGSTQGRAALTEGTAQTSSSFLKAGNDSQTDCSDGILEDSQAHYPQPSLMQLMDAIKDCKSSLASQIEGVHVDLSLLKQDLQGLRERVTEVETRVSSLDDTVVPLTRDVSILQRDLSACRIKLDDLENRSRRNNLRFVGFPERAEGSSPEEFLERWLKDSLPDLRLSSSFAIERAHRTPPNPPRPGASPRPLIARILNFRDKVAILRAARDAGELLHASARISIYPDFSSEVQRQRASFLEVKGRLRQEGLQYAMFFPAKLRVLSDGKSVFFFHPDEVSDWLDGRGLPQRKTPKRRPR